MHGLLRAAHVASHRPQVRKAWPADPAASNLWGPMPPRIFSIEGTMITKDGAFKLGMFARSGKPKFVAS